MTTNAKHTPGPWWISENGTNSTICAKDGEKPYSVVIAETCGYKTEREANAAFVVRACNAHEELLEAVREMHEENITVEKQRRRGYQFITSNDAMLMHKEEEPNCSYCAVISKAEGK